MKGSLILILIAFAGISLGLTGSHIIEHEILLEEVYESSEGLESSQNSLENQNYVEHLNPRNNARINANDTKDITFTTQVNLEEVDSRFNRDYYLVGLIIQDEELGKRYYLSSERFEDNEISGTREVSFSTHHSNIYEHFENTDSLVFRTAIAQGTSEDPNFLSFHSTVFSIDD